MRGMTQLGVRWNMVICFATFWISGRICTAVQPVSLLESRKLSVRRGHLTIAEQSNLLASQIIRPIPSGRVHLLAREAVQALDVRPLGLIELSNSTHQEVASNNILGVELGILAALSCRNTSLPLLGLVVPDGIFNRRVEPDVLIKIVLLRRFDQIREDFLLAWVFTRPVAVLSETVAVQRAPNITCTAWILVVVPAGRD